MEFNSDSSSSSFSECGSDYDWDKPKQAIYPSTSEQPQTTSEPVHDIIQPSPVASSMNFARINEVIDSNTSPNSLDEDDFDVACNETCKIQKCYEGCDLWTEAISSTCHDVCEEETKVFKRKSSLYCVRGCNIAVNMYIESIEEELGTPAAPYLVAESTNTSISIAWAASPLKNISYLVQLKYDGIHSSDWEYYQPFNLLRVNSLRVQNLHPYTKYRFRVAWILLENYPPLFSEESFVISTLPYGVPATSPIITCITVVSCCRVSVSWNPPSEPNGPILSYVLYIREYPSGNIMIKDVSDTSDGLHYMINNLKPSTQYVISLSTRNTVGEGPADERNVTTFPEKETSNTSSPPAYLVFAAKQKVLKQGLRILDVPYVLYETLNKSIIITGIALHTKYNLFFISDSEGSVHSVSLKGGRKIKTIIEANENYPHSLSLDWLNGKLYMVEENQITRSDITGNNYEILISNLKTRPTDIHVDPLNGYLYWVMRDPLSGGGLYRTDLIEFESGCIPSEKSELIISDNHIMAFAVDYKNFRLLLPAATNNTIVSVAQDGSDVADIRENAQTPQYRNIKSMAVHQNLLYWTSDKDLFGEEYHKRENKFYQNVYSVGEGPFIALNIDHTDSQPHPVPLNPVESVEVLFGHDRAKIKWLSPRRLAGEGKGSYKKWLYEIHLFEEGKKLVQYGANITRNIHYLHSLKYNTSYSVKLRAYSTGGKGPWSSEFTGRTLDKKNNGYPVILWGAQDGLLKSNAIGEDVALLIHKFNINNARITDICAYDRMLFINTNTSYVYIHNASVHNSLTRLQNISMASAIALDWFAPKLYWSSPVQQIISRSNLDGSQPEPLPILTMAREIAIDSVNAYLYYATSHSVERSRLNGRYHFVYMQNALFSGKHVMGLTLDFDKKHVYWMIRSYEGSFMYRSCLAEGNGSNCNPDEPDVIGELFQEGLYGPFWYFSNRLYWLHEKQRAFVSDVNGKNLAEVDGLGLNGISSLGIIDPSLQPYPVGYTKDSIKVVPLSVPEHTVCIDGTAEQFNITWSPDTSVNYGTVFYEIRVDDGDEIYNLVTSETVFVYPTMKYLSPYTSLTIAIQAFTFYASARQTIVYRHSPMSVPSKPLQPRVFISYKSSPLIKNQDIIAIYRWSPPEEANGVVIGYKITCWYIEDEMRVPVCDDMVSGKTLEFRSSSLLPNTTYFFQVSGITEAGEGMPSDITEAETSVEKPIPQLLLANADGVRVADIDSHEERLVYNKAVHPAAVAYLAQERRVFWMEEGALMVSSMDGKNTSQMKRLSSEGTCLTVDWIGKNLYYAEVNKKEGYSNIMGVDLTHDSEPKHILNHSSIITSLEVEPFSGSLIWTLASENSCNLMISDVTGSNVRPFFSRALEYETFSTKVKVKRTTGKTCNCKPSTSVSSAITIDSANSSQPKILFVDDKFGHIWASDIEGCTCHLLFNATENNGSGLPPSSLTADKMYIYWSNETLGKLYSIPKELKRPKSRLMEELYDSSQQNPSITEEIRGIRSIRAIGNHLQPYPDPTCLLLVSFKEKAELEDKTSTTLKLHLPPMHRPKHCSKMSFPSVRYTVYYEPTTVASQDSCFVHLIESCKSVSSYNNSITLENLQPYTYYTIGVSVKNYYTKENSFLGPFVEFRTNVGVPSPPLNITAVAVTPRRIDISWKPPQYLNGPYVSYEVFWKVKGSSISTFSAIHSECGNHSSTNELSMIIMTSEPGQEHHMMVRAYSSNCMFYNDSEEVLVTALPLPNNLTLEATTSTSLLVSWIPPDNETVSDYNLTYKETDEAEWYEDVTKVVLPESKVLFDLHKLTPKTKYNMKLILWYGEKEVVFVWPKVSFFEFMTAGDVPSIPGKPELKLMGRDIFEVFWYSSINYGYEELIYELQQRSENSDSEEWITVYNSTNPEWTLDGISANINYEFRVRAFNEYGYSNYSYSEKPFYLPETGAYIDPVDDPIGVVVASCVVIAVLLVCVVSTLYIMHMKKREKNKKILADVAASNQLVPDLELATLQDLPLHANFVHQTNALYNLSDLPTDEELSSLPQVQRNQIILTKFLGSGAFGEVFEGIVYGLNDETPSLKIAIKTLKKGATDHEKEEFLKEAKLMSNFKHDHILQLLGVCFNNNPNFIILELMEGGDLLSFLRSNRPTVYQSSNLTMDDLIGICIDVAEGCKYLEDMHFVHRDLAARNCLVSSYDRNERIVKIGDFGLARDIYKNDYYRKEGEGLLPVRWMAPESLVYGVFTSHSDVWAFGVLLWEVITLGQQPYPARSNMEVLYYVRAGGRLDKPENCPDDLHDVMLKCWSYDAESRPTFCYCLSALKELRQKLVSSSVVMPSVYNFSYVADTNIVNIPLGFDNFGYCGSEFAAITISETANDFVPISAEYDFMPVTTENSFVPVTTENNFVPVTVENDFVPVTTESDFGPGTYIGQNDFEESSENKLGNQNVDSRSIQSDRAVSSEMDGDNTTSRRRSSSWTSAMFDLPSSSSVTQIPKTSNKRPVNKYLELLGDNEDADGYQLPLQFHGSLRRSAQTNTSNSQAANNRLPTSAINVCCVSEQSTKPLLLNSEKLGLCNSNFHADETKVPEELSLSSEQHLVEVTHDFSSESENFPSWLEDCDDWSVSTASTATCPIDTTTKRLSGLSTLSCLSGVSGIDLNYASKSSFC